MIIRSGRVWAFEARVTQEADQRHADFLGQFDIPTRGTPAAGAAGRHRQLVADQLAVAAGENRRSS